MARVTVEDCIEKVQNRFELIIAASQRAREISNGVQIEVDKDNDKNTVISLREIGDSAITYDDLKERYLKSRFLNFFCSILFLHGRDMHCVPSVDTVLRTRPQHEKFPPFNFFLFVLFLHGRDTVHVPSVDTGLNIRNVIKRNYIHKIYM